MTPMSKRALDVLARTRSIRGSDDEARRGARHGALRAIGSGAVRAPRIAAVSPCRRDGRHHPPFTNKRGYLGSPGEPLQAGHQVRSLPDRLLVQPRQQRSGRNPRGFRLRLALDRYRAFAQRAAHGVRPSSMGSQNFWSKIPSPIGISRGKGAASVPHSMAVNCAKRSAKASVEST
jgi:hypothetical protein